MREMKRQIFDLVLTDLEKDGKSVYNTSDGLAVSLGSLHSGTTFTTLIQLTDEEMNDIQDALENGIHPVFSLHFKYADKEKNWKHSVVNGDRMDRMDTKPVNKKDRRQPPKNGKKNSKNK